MCRMSALEDIRTQYHLVSAGQGHRVQRRQGKHLAAHVKLYICPAQKHCKRRRQTIARSTTNAVDSCHDEVSLHAAGCDGQAQPCPLL